MSAATNIHPKIQIKTSSNVATQDDWSMYGHDAQHTGFSTSSAPNYYGKLWSRRIGSETCGSPVISEGRMYFISYEDLSIYSLNTSNGKVIWKKQMGSDIDLIAPAVSDGKVFVPVRKKLYALDMYTGEEIWNKTFTRIIFKPPIVSDNMVFITELTTSFSVSALDVDTGNLIWEQKIEDAVHAPPAIYDGRIYVNTGNGIYVLDEFNGSIIWHDFQSMFLSEYPVIQNGKIYESYHDTETIFAIDISTRKKVWELPVIGIPSKITAGYGNIYVGTWRYYEGETSFFYSIDGETGEVVWKKDFGGSWTIHTLAPVADGKVFVIAVQRGIWEWPVNTVLFVLNAFNGEYLWSVNFGPAYVHDNVVVAEDKLFVSPINGVAFAFVEKKTKIVSEIEYDEWNFIGTPKDPITYIKNFEKDGYPPGDFGHVTAKITVENTGTEDAQVNVKVTVTGDVTMVILDPHSISNDVIVPSYHFSYTELVLSRKSLSEGSQNTWDLSIPIKYSSLIVGDIQLPDPYSGEKVSLNVVISILSANIKLEVFGNFDTITHEIQDIRGIGDPGDLIDYWNGELYQRIQQKMLRDLMERYFTQILDIDILSNPIPNVPTGIYTTTIDIYPGVEKVVVTILIPTGVTLLELSMLPLGAVNPVIGNLITNDFAMINIINPTIGLAEITVETASPDVNMTLQIVQTLPQNVIRTLHEITVDEETFYVVTVSNSTVSSVDFDKSENKIGFNVTTTITGFCYVEIPKSLMNFSKLLIDGVQVTPTTYENQTYTFLYFNYTGTHEIEIRGTTKPIEPPDFHVKVFPEVQSIYMDEEAIYTINITSINNFDLEVSLSIEFLPDNITSKFNPTSVIPPKNGSVTSQLTLSTSKVGMYGLRIVAQSGSIKHTFDITLEVTKKPTPTLSVTLATNRVEINSGESLTITVTVTHGGNPIENATITLSSNRSDLFTTTSGRTDVTGKFSKNITLTVSLKTTIKFTATASKTGYLDDSDEIQITILPPISPPTEPDKGMPSWLIAVIILLVVIALVIVIRFRIRRKKTLKPPLFFFFFLLLMYIYY